MPARPPIAEARRVVVKLGTRVLTHDTGELALARLFEVIETVASAWSRGTEVILVTSGAVGFGVQALGLSEAPRELPLRQACAAVGQSRLMGLYEAGFGRLGRVVGQVLLSQSDFDDRARYLNLRSTLQALIAHGVVPVLNENDAVSVEELALFGEGPAVFGDNDRLSALVAAKLGAELLVLLTDVDGVYDRDPRLHAEAARLDRLALATDAARGLEAGASVSGAGRGGMKSKVEAARIAAKAGCQVVIASGRRPGELARVLAGEDAGTWIPALDGLSARRRWIAHAAAVRGVLHLDAGAVAALHERGASLLAVGVTRVEGDFAGGDVVELRGPQGDRLGRGIVACSAPEARSWGVGAPPRAGRHQTAQARRRVPLVHRDHLVLDGVPGP